jgi:hypothetical protein
VSYSNFDTTYTTNWIGLFIQNAPTNGFSQYKYVSGKSGSITFDASTLGSGKYIVKGFYNGNYTVQCSSGTINITSSTVGDGTSGNMNGYDSIEAVKGIYSSYYWKDLDGDGDWDVINYTDGKVSEGHLRHAAAELQKGSFGKLDIVFIRSTNAINDAENDSYAGYISEMDIDYWGYASYGPNSKVRMTSQWDYSYGNFLHEMMHNVCILNDEKANGGDSIMDYDYKKNTLSNYDKGLLKYLLSNVKSGTNNRPDIINKSEIWHKK